MVQKHGVAVGLPAVGPIDAGLEINAQIAAANDLLATSPVSADDYASWELMTRNVLMRAFGANHDNVNAVMEVGKSGAFFMDAGPAYWAEHRRKSLTTQVAKLRALASVLNLTVSPDPTVARLTPSAKQAIFLVHGRDARRHEVAAFLRALVPSLGLTVLDEKPSSGKTIIEKLEAHADCAFAVVLMTGDDRGGLSGEPHEKQRPRARQNVVLELGYFMGKLGRERVCPLYEAEVELPSDYDGVGFVPLDAGGGWKARVARELKAVGVPVNTDALL